MNDLLITIIKNINNKKLGINSLEIIMMDGKNLQNVCSYYKIFGIQMKFERQFDIFLMKKYIDPD